MPFIEAHRVWLGDVFQVSRFAPGSDEDLTEKAKQGYEKTLANLNAKGLESLVEQPAIIEILKRAKLDTAYTDAVESVKNLDPSQSSPQVQLSLYTMPKRSLKKFTASA